MKGSHNLLTAHTLQDHGDGYCDPQRIASFL
jgi:hypothetical protein